MLTRLFGAPARSRTPDSARHGRRTLQTGIAALAIGALLAIGLPTTAFAAPGDGAPDVTSETTLTPAPEAPETEAPGTEAPDAPETEAPETEAPETEAPETEAPDAPVTDAPATEPPASQQRVAPLSVDGAGKAVAKKPTSTTSIIKVAKGDVRTGSGNDAIAHTYAVGARFQLLADDDGDPGAPLGEPWSECTITADDNGICYFSVPDTNRGGDNRNEEFWVQEIAPAVGSVAAANYDIAGSFQTGGGTDVTLYAYRTPQLQANTSYSMPEDQSKYSSVFNTSGLWANKLKNPTLQPRCDAGLKVAMLFDLSGSVKNANAAGTLGVAGKGFIDALAGTSSSVALFSFGNTSPRAGTSNKPALRSADTAATALKSDIQGYIDSFTAPGYDSNGTNWDRGLWEVAKQASAYDIVVVLTDGNPTFSGASADGPGNSTYFRELERAIFSANAIKDLGKRVITVGIGADLSAHNLSAISGPNGYTPGSTLNTADYFSTGWAQLKPLLTDFAKSVTCQVPITIHKTEVPATGQPRNGKDWTFTPSNVTKGALSPNGPQLTDASGNAAWTLKFAAPGDQGSVSFAETQKPGWALESVVCNGQNMTVGGDGKWTVSAKVGDPAITCEVRNKQAAPATVKVNKQWVVNGAASALNTIPSGFTTGLTLAPAPADTPVAFGTTHTGYVAGNPLTVGERYTTPTQCNAVTTNYETVAGAAIGQGGAVAALAAGANEYTIVNTVECGASLTLEKVVVNDDGGQAKPADWNGKLQAGDAAFRHGETKTVAAGSHVLSEQQLAGYAQTGLTCVGGTFDAATKTVTLGALASATCTFTNDDIAPTLQLLKKVAGSDVSNTNWVLAATGTKGSSVTDPAGGDTAVVDVKAGEKFTLGETATQYGADFTAGDWACTVDGAPLAVEQGQPGAATTSTALTLGQHAACEITNTAKPVTVTHEKTLVDASAAADGSWNLEYLVTVTNPSRVAAAEYDLADEFRFGASVLPTAGTAIAEFRATGSAAWAAIDGWNGVDATQLASDRGIAKQATHEYRVRVNVSIAAGADFSAGGALDCSAKHDERAFRNVATLNGSVEDDACGEPALPSFSKTAGSAAAVAGAPGQWDLSYTLTVTNASDEELYYGLDDPTPALPAGVTAVGSPTISPLPSGQTGLPFTGVKIAKAGAEPTEHEYTVTIRVAVAADAPAAGLSCETTPGTSGVVNRATLTSSGQGIPGDACVGIPVAEITHEKNVDSASVTQAADGTWSVTYSITVTNDDTIGGSYDLADATAFGAGISYPADGATSVVGPAGVAVATDWNGQDRTGIADDVWIAADAEHVYTVTVSQIAVGAGVIGTAAGTCPDAETPGAFNNVSSLTVGGVIVADDACAAPTLPVLSKTPGSATQADDGSWNVDYTITVDNADGAASHYALTDTAAFTADAEINSWTVEFDDVTIIDAADYTDGIIVASSTPREIAAGATHVYTVTFNVEVPAGSTGLECTGEPGSGFFNSATLTSGADERGDATCIPVTEVGVPTVEKTVKSTVQGDDGEWTITYDLVVSGNPAHVTRYSLTDTLDFGDGIVVKSAAWNGASSGTWNDLPDTRSATLATDVKIGVAPATQRYTVVVVAAVPAGAFTEAPAQLVCANDQADGDGTAFLNRATLTSGNTTPQHVEACAAPATPKIEKSVIEGPVADGDDWKVTYLVTVANTHATQALRYSLRDTPDFAEGTQIVSATAVNDAGFDTTAWNGRGETGLVSNVALDGGQTHRYTVTVTFSVAADAQVGDFVCGDGQDGAGHGTFNSATVTSGADSFTDVDCASIPVTVELRKVWRLNGEEFADADAPAFLRGAASPTLDGVEQEWGTVYGPRVAGSNVVIGESVDALPTGCVAGDAAGLGTKRLSKPHNVFTITNPVECAANLTIDKQAVSSTQLEDGRWKNVYSITVDNDSPVIDVDYDLTDTLEGYGAGITVDEASWTGRTEGSWNLLPIIGGPTATLADDETIDGGSDAHVYTVTVIATVGADAWAGGDEAPVLCVGTDAEPGDGGFRNSATLTPAGEEPRSDSACDEPARPSVEKTVLAEPVQNADGDWTVSYALTVTNSSEKPVFYDLSDTLRFAGGVTVLDAAATNNAGFDTDAWSGDGVLVENETIAAGAGHIFTITVRAELGTDFSVDDALCGESGSGFLNTAVLTSGRVDIPAEACAEIPVGELVLVKHVDNGAFDGLETAPHELATPGDWRLSADGPEQLSVTGDDSGTAQVVQVGDYLLTEAADSDNPLLWAYSEGEWACKTDGTSSSATVVAGGRTVCEITNTGETVDLAIEKRHVAQIDGEGTWYVPTDTDSRYSYTVTVTNNGEIAAPGAVVTDEIPATLAVDTTNWTVPAGWTAELTGADADGFGGVLTLTAGEDFAPDAEAVFGFWVTTAAELPREGDDPQGKIADIVNTAVVTSDGIERTPDDNTSTERTPVKSVEVSAVGICEANAPWVDYEVTPYNTENVDPLTIVLVWWTSSAYEQRDPSIPASDSAAIMADGASRVDPITIPEGWTPGQAISGRQLWPGAAIDENGTATAWPGWTLQPNGGWKLDPAAPFYDLRGGTVVEVRMNPSTAGVETYPPATPDCNPAPPGQLPSTGYDPVWAIGLGGALVTAGVLFLLAFWLRRRRGEAA
ncbi:DUF11 domain-containing protein [Agromyces laixinhei]|uniref:DUF11 domain-containing protein n=1 Tax=Agromyces laixinhei TaxID=2585717 RepID=UPI0018DD30FD|nr:DUF11 domain-containing protein [Agromyces laixinhei]